MVALAPHMVVPRVGVMPRAKLRTLWQNMEKIVPKDISNNHQRLKNVKKKQNLTLENQTKCITIQGDGK